MSCLPRSCWWLLVIACAVALPRDAMAYTPGTGAPDAADGFVVNRADRRDVLAFYNCAYQASRNFPRNLSWSGDVTTGVPGTTGPLFKEDVRRRINFFRALGGLPADIVFDETKSAKCQEAALMFSANDAISHFPPNTWAWFTVAAAQAAGSANIALGNHGPDAVDAFMIDDGAGNEATGHRRWLLFPRARQMGTGDVPLNGVFNSTNAIWVIGDFAPASAPKFVPWPNSGFVPRGLVPARWSLSYPGADFSLATVTMTQGGREIPVAVNSRSKTGAGDNTLVWTPTGVPATVTTDLPFTVTVSDIGGAGVPVSTTYTTTLFNPDFLGESVEITGTATPATTGESYPFNTIAQADGYELAVSTDSAAPWTEGAEDDPSSQIADHTTGGFTLRETSQKRTGAMAFHLAFPEFADQGFVVTRDVVPSATSQLQWHDLGRFATDATTLSAEISTDNGITWTAVFSRPGVGLNSGLWDRTWRGRSVSLAAFAGQVVHVRFILRQNGGPVVVSATPNDGFFIDEISVTNAIELVRSVTTPLSATAATFSLNAATAGAVLEDGGRYHLRIRPNVGTRWYGFGALKTVTARAQAVSALSP